MATRTLKNFMATPFEAELTEGQHSAILTGWEYVSNNDPDKEYIRTTFNVDNCGKTQSYARNMFIKDISIMLSQVRKQLNRENETLQPVAFLNELVKEATPLQIWVDYRLSTNKNGMRRYQNLNFRAPLLAEEENGEDMEIPE